MGIPSQSRGRGNSVTKYEQVSTASSSRYSSDTEHDDGAVVMSATSREDSAKGREIGVTRPKRRLSSLPSLPTTPLMNSPPESRAMSATSSPPASPATYGSYDSLAAQGRNSHAHSAHQHMSYPPTVARIDEKPSQSSRYVAPQPAGQSSASSSSAVPDASGPRLFGIELKWISLMTLALQNAFLTIIMHYSRIVTEPSKTYSPAAAVLLNELLKGLISVCVALWGMNDGDSSAAPAPAWAPRRAGQGAGGIANMFTKAKLQRLRREVFSSDCYKLAIPAILYVIQNNLQYVASSNLDVATFQVTYQMKILTTAFFSVLLLGKRLSRPKWCALVMLALGVGIVQLQSTSAPAHGPPASGPTGTAAKEAALRADLTPQHSHLPAVMHPFRGFVAVTLACMTSGLAGVYFEYLLKTGSPTTGQPSLWIRNTQLSLFSVLPALVPIVFSHPEGMSWFSGVLSKFANFNGWAIGTVLTQTFGGLITALVIRYSDNILKGFATSLSIIISFMASVALFNSRVTFSFVAGATIVLGATFLYNSPSIPDMQPTRTSVAVAPGSPIPTSAPILGEPQAPSRTSSIVNLLAGLSSRPGSRRPSGGGSDNPRPFPPVPPLSRSGSYNSTPGSPFAQSARNSQTGLDVYGRQSPSPTKLRPTLSVDTDRKA